MIRKHDAPSCPLIGTTKKTRGSTMSSCEPRPGEIWLAYVDFLDHPGMGKVRPVFVIDVQKEMCIAIARKGIFA